MHEVQNDRYELKRDMDIDSAALLVYHMEVSGRLALDIANLELLGSLNGFIWHVFGMDHYIVCSICISNRHCFFD